MKFKEPLLQGIFVKRYKRFFVDIKYKNKIITAHCPNTGSMMGLLDKNNNVLFSKSDNPDRKLKYTLQIIKNRNSLVGVNTHLTNKIVSEALLDKKIKIFAKYNLIKNEVKFSQKTRFDFLISNNKEKCFVEVKNVTLTRKNKVAEFPDSPTSRGTKHLNDLSLAIQKGFKSYILYVVQRNDCKSFKIAGDIDEIYKYTFDKALKNGVNVLCYDCKLTNEEIKLNKEIKLT
jgi:sugar fermentation stimulation protein A|tara:strand:+ start:527 stop:1219 length:693 start_codon:yes stop_codon:yes gene_type:complete